MSVPIRDEDGSLYSKYRAKVVATAALTKNIDVITFTEELRYLCKVLGYNFAGLWTQAAHETGPTPFGSKVWLDYTNPAGIKTLSGNNYQRYRNGVDAARALVVHMSAYVPPPKSPVLLTPYLYLDSRYQFAKAANKGIQYHTYDDLAGHWAEDPTYGKQINEKFQRWFGG